MGELHLEVIKHRLLRDYKLNVRVHKPRVSYRESIQKAVEVTGDCHRTMSGQSHFARLTIRMEPFAASPVPIAVPAPEVGGGASAGVSQRGDGGPERVRAGGRHARLPADAR